MYANVHAIVLCSRPTQERSCRLSLYTREKGRLYATVRGLGRPNARLEALTQDYVAARLRLWIKENKIGRAHV